MTPSRFTERSGSPSVRCGSTTVAGANFAFQVPELARGVTVTGFVVEPGGANGFSADAPTSVNTPSYGYGPPAGRNGVAGLPDLHTCTVYVPPETSFTEYTNVS